MAQLVSLTCPSCGGNLQITDDIERFACAHCGNEHVVRRSGNVVSLAPVVEGLKQVQAGVDRGASELALRRLSAEIQDLEFQIKALLNSFEVAKGHDHELDNDSIERVIRQLEADLRKKQKTFASMGGAFDFYTFALMSKLTGEKGVPRSPAEWLNNYESRIRGAIPKLRSLIHILEDKRTQLNKHQQIVGR